MARPSLALVTVLYRSAAVLPGFFHSLSTQRGRPFSLYVIDNSDDPADSSHAALMESAQRWPVDNLHVVRNAANLGVAEGNNQGIRLALAAGAEYVLLLNNDIEFESATLLDDIVRIAQTRSASLVSPRIYYFDDRTVWYGGGYINEARGTTVHTGMGEKDTPLTSTERFVGYAPTCFMLVHRSVFDRVGLMDERYFVYYDDTDFVLRANRAGLQVLYWPDGVVLHKVSSSTGGNLSPFSVRLANRNRVYFIRKNFAGWSKVRALLFYLATRPTRREFWAPRLRPTLLRAISEGLAMPIGEAPASDRA